MKANSAENQWILVSEPRSHCFNHLNISLGNVFACFIVGAANSLPLRQFHYPLVCLSDYQELFRFKFKLLYQEFLNSPQMLTVNRGHYSFYSA